MKLYYSPLSTASRPLLMFIADNDIDVDLQLVDLMSGEHVKPPYLALNPSGLVPTLEDGDFRLTECSAILKYLADKISSPTYPRELRQRARIENRLRRNRREQVHQRVVRRHDRRVIGELLRELVAHAAAQMDVQRRRHEDVKHEEFRCEQRREHDAFYAGN